METTKKLSVNTAVCDLTEITEERLSQYSEININAAAVIQSEKSALLTAKYPVSMNTACALKVPDGTRLVLKNGSAEIGEKDIASEHTILFVSGELFIHPAAGNAVDSYEKIVVNGSLLYPESLAASVSKIQVNGKQKSYPDHAVCLQKDVVVDKYFILRARQNTSYFITGTVSILDPDSDIRTLLEKQVTLLCTNAAIAENLFVPSLPLFPDHTEIEIIPDGCCILPDNITINSGTIRTFGKKLYKRGNLILTRESIEALSELEYLKVTGTLYIPEKCIQEISDLPVEYGTLFTSKGTLVKDQSIMHIDRQLLEQETDGLHVIDCAVAEIADDVTPELIRDRLKLEDIAVVRCSDALKNAARLVSGDIAVFEDFKEEPEADEDNTTYVNAASYKF